MDVAQFEQHRVALTGHCYRMLGSAVDSDDAVQETMIRAWRAFARFEGRSSVRTWLYRIATNVCLDALASRKRRARPFEGVGPGSVGDPLVERPASHWLEPIPDSQVLPEHDPAAQTLRRESVRLAFIAALQHLPPKQRAVLLLTQVLGWSAAEVADCLQTSVAAVNSALQRARSTMRTVDTGVGAEPLTGEQEALLERYVTAFECYDVDGLTSLMCEDATLSMPPYTMWLQGPQVIGQWLRGRGIGCKGSRLVPTRANGLPAFGQYRQGPPGEPHRPWSLIVLELRGPRILAWNAFLDTERLFVRFGLPPEL